MLAHNAIDWSGKTVNQLQVDRPDPSRRGYWLCNCSCGKRCSIGSMQLRSGQKSCGCARRKQALNFRDLTGVNFGRLRVVSLGPKKGNLVRWNCICTCGAAVLAYGCNLLSERSTACKRCGHQKQITGEKIGLLTAVSQHLKPAGHPLWTFKCDCGGTIQGTVREFRANFLRSCGCHDNTYSSWAAMMARCYEPKNNRYMSYGGRGISVCERWHKFDNFVADMGERPKRHNLGRKKAEGNYEPSNCNWEHVSLNCRDTKNDGTPTRPGLRKGAKPRNVIEQ